MIANSEFTNCENCPSFKKSIFCNLSKEGSNEIESLKTVNRYKKGQNMFVQGAQNYGAYCIKSGKVKITKLGHEGKETIVQIASGGELLGHRNIFGNTYSSDTVTALEDIEVCFFTKQQMSDVISRKPEVAQELISKISNQISLGEDRITSLSQYNVRERLSDLLIFLKNSFGVKVGDRFKLDLSLSREEMASMVGMAPETLVRFLSELKSEGLVSQEGKTLFLTEELRIRKFSGLMQLPSSVGIEPYHVAG